MLIQRRAGLKKKYNVEHMNACFDIHFEKVKQIRKKKKKEFLEIWRYK